MGLESWMNVQSKVSLIKSRDHYTGVRKCLAPIKDDIKTSLSKISSLVIKINFVDARKELTTTPFQAVKSFIDFISPFYEGEIVIAEQATWGETREGFQRYGFMKLAEENSQIKLLDLGEDETIVRTIKHPEGELELRFSRTILEAPFLVSIARPKTHCTVVVTSGIKNVLVGVVNGGWNERLKIHKGKFIHNIMTSIADLTYPDLVIIDGTVGMEGDGPINGTEIKAGWVLVSFAALAADSLATHLMGFDINDVGYLNMLEEKGFGLLYPNREIEIVGENPQDLITPFKPHCTPKKQRMWR